MDIEERIRTNFNRQAFMKKIEAELTLVQEGLVKITCPFSHDLTQQNGYYHAGVLTTIADSACGYAALSMMPVGADVLSVEFKTQLMRPAKSGDIIAVGKVIKHGKRLSFCEGSVFDAKEEKEYARMTATMICIV